MIPGTILNCNFIAKSPRVETVPSQTSALPVAAIPPTPRCLFLDYFPWHLAPDPRMRLCRRQPGFLRDVNGTPTHEQRRPRQDWQAVLLQGIRRLCREPLNCFSVRLQIKMLERLVIVDTWLEKGGSRVGHA
jgi:hypothetical protein